MSHLHNYYAYDQLKGSVNLQYKMAVAYTNDFTGKKNAYCVELEVLHDQ